MTNIRTSPWSAYAFGTDESQERIKQLEAEYDRGIALGWETSQNLPWS